jgi:hypothetical protein
MLRTVRMRNDRRIVLISFQILKKQEETEAGGDGSDQGRSDQGRSDQGQPELRDFSKSPRSSADTPRGSFMRRRLA